MLMGELASILDTQLSASAHGALSDRLFETRRLSIELAAPLSAEDMVVQAMEDASPTKWHLAHTSWFFETFVLTPYLTDYQLFDEAFNYCFNSYYEHQGPRQPRPKRGLLTRPSLDRVLAYREHVDLALAQLLAEQTNAPKALFDTLEVGINHEQQHQELMLTDILSLFAANPLKPAYRPTQPRSIPAPCEPLRWIDFAGGVFPIGHGGKGFAWDNEGPRHEVLLRPFRLADRLVTNREWLAFVADGGYETATLWLSDGWAAILRENWHAPLYWESRDGEWFEMSLEGLQPLNLDAPVAHVSYYEADAFARWSGKRLPTEFEWEVAAAAAPKQGNFLETAALHPRPAEVRPNGSLRQMFGDVWEWTQSAYLPYPGYRAPEGALGEYNGKFMVGQHVLRGGSCVTPQDHVRPSYRNFFYPHQRWQFLGLRLASEIA
ncbi:ergothioneine biosynthesis protein EgtB [Methylocystis sp. L43]|uniref:ergothioneine biosynthesis protein EgtB n=1 Tax=unclassified Methylocystis TaxID=2625913 RepID=UPI0018C23773|nr:MULTISPECIES: ergothioneine biosynthesis protein EgtB [unclassified Methylocystis]MBG0799644.1 ergothioneine biosynthesis protein EgtB [Methylocystis sp. L43]MBG0807427.1 ergothioneine biosynthesis protein EgtB [Methylocystis sp. H15]